MTRESKLALIIGFVLVLVVGVLVSDHFSQANNMDLEINQPSDGRIGAPITDLGQREQQGIQNAINPPEDSTELAGSQSPGEALDAPLIISNSSRDPNYQLADAQNGNGAGIGGDSLIDRAFEEARRRVQETELPAAAQPSRNGLNPDGNTARPLPAPSYASYTVAAGDSLIAIARRLLGDGERWREIHELNADKLGPDAILQIGMSLKLPGDALIASPAPTNLRTPSLNSKPREYTVVPGDTLGEISMRLLGTSKRTDEIVKLNGLASANEIFVGMTLKIPAK